MMIEVGGGWEVMMAYLRILHYKTVVGKWTYLHHTSRKMKKWGKKGLKGGKNEGVKEEGGHIRLSNFTCLIVSQMLPKYQKIKSFE